MVTHLQHNASVRDKCEPIWTTGATFLHSGVFKVIFIQCNTVSERAEGPVSPSTTGPAAVSPTHPGNDENMHDPPKTSLHAELIPACISAKWLFLFLGHQG